ncbi:MAG: DegT/DnrJ/EryC1/StrS family aminotransferase [Bacteroidia bacterium]|nr:DegT/DnrJ/EryC1/StrS family aminotransferase [Bacteroidia bacterium]
MIPFSPPHISQSVIDEVVDSLRSGWITTGPKTKLLESEVAKYVGSPKVLCLNSATAGLELALRWFGVKAGDEVILPAYTYSATANVVMHCGATPVLVDVQAEDFNISIKNIQAAISPRTKVIMPVDIAGYPCDYQELFQLVSQSKTLELFQAENLNQQKLGRILVLSDAAHSFGAIYHGKKSAQWADMAVFSFHAVKNLTTAEGGALCLNLPASFNPEEEYKNLVTKALHGQNKDALAKTQKGNWEYDIVEPGYKWNMPDVLAAIGLASLRTYDGEDLVRRKSIMDQYNKAFEKYPWAELPIYESQHKTSSYHLYMLRIKGVSLAQRNEIIQRIFDKDVSVNVHFKPIPLLSAYSDMFSINNYPVAYDNYCREISLPVYFDLNDSQVEQVIQAVVSSVAEVLN